MKYLLLLALVFVSASAFSQSKPSKPKPVDTIEYDVKITDTTGMVLAYVKKGENDLKVVKGEAAAKVLFDELNKATRMYMVLNYEKTLLMNIVTNIGVTGSISDPEKFGAALKAFLDYQYKKK